MILSDQDIRKEIEAGRISFDPMPDFETQLQPASMDMRLGNEFKVFNHSQTPFIDLQKPETFENLTQSVFREENEPFVIHPHEFILGIVKESITLPDDVSVRIDGRSSLGRLGIIVHSTAGSINPGFSGQITLEMTNIGMMPVLMYPGMRVCQYVFHRLESPSLISYRERKDAKYNYQTSPGESKIVEEIK